MDKKTSLFLRFLKEEKALDKYVTALKDQRWRECRTHGMKKTFLDMIRRHDDNVLDMSFTWSETKQSWKFWCDLNAKFKKLYSYAIN